jgi:hypothetical protein
MSPHNLAPGVLTGDDVGRAFALAKQHGFALPPRTASAATA